MDGEDEDEDEDRDENEAYWSWLVKNPLEDPLASASVLSQVKCGPSLFSSLLCETAPPSVFGLLSGPTEGGWAAEAGEGGDG